MEEPREQPRKPRPLLRSSVGDNHAHVDSNVLLNTPRLTKAGGSAIIKSQLLRGGLRGGVQIVQTPKEGEDAASTMLGHKQPSESVIDDSLTVRNVYVSELAELTDEWYMAMTIDRETYSPALVISKAGGRSIEDITRDHPETLLRYPITMSEGITIDLLTEVTHVLGISPAESIDLEHILLGLYRIFIERDATHLEVNPLARLPDGSLRCVSTAFTFDDAAAKRQPELFALRDVEHEVADEVEAERHGLVYVRMDGNIGNVVNGAGLAMATNDAIGLYGGASANFLDAGGQATKETMLKAFAIVMRDPRVKAILVNVYGGEKKRFRCVVYID